MDFDEHDDDDDMAPPPSNPKTSVDPTTTTTPGSSSHRPLSSIVRGGGGAAAKYRECLKNHAVTIGGHAVDGCGEFMPAGEGGSLDALRCAACSCHRNFHRRETPSAAAAFSPYNRTPSGYLHHHPFLQHRPPPPLALPSTSGGAASRGDDEEYSDPMAAARGGAAAASGSGSKKRHRTKFTQEQKESMLGFAERIGWRIHKHDEGAVQQFCNETGVKRHVLKVWMHNNKHTLGKKQQP